MAFHVTVKMVNQWPEQVRMLQESTAQTLGQAVQSAVKVVVAPYALGDGPRTAADAAHMEVMPGWTDADTRVEEDDSDPTDALVKEPAWMRPEVALLGDSDDGPFGVEGLKLDPDRYAGVTGNEDAGWGR